MSSFEQGLVKEMGIVSEIANICRANFSLVFTDILRLSNGSLNMTYDARCKIQ